MNKYENLKNEFTLPRGRPTRNCKSLNRKSKILDLSI